MTGPRGRPERRGSHPRDVRCRYSPVVSWSLRIRSRDFSTKKQLSPNVYHENLVARASVNGSLSTARFVCLRHLKTRDMKALPIVIAVSLLQITSIQAAQKDAPNAGATPGAVVAQFQAFKIVSYSAVALKDGGLEEPVDGKSFIVGQPNEAVAAVLRGGGAITG